jgi:hypothetical protein
MVCIMSVVSMLLLTDGCLLGYVVIVSCEFCVLFRLISFFNCIFLSIAKESKLTLSITKMNQIIFRLLVPTAKKTKHVSVRNISCLTVLPFQSRMSGLQQSVT